MCAEDMTEGVFRRLQWRFGICLGNLNMGVSV